MSDSNSCNPMGWIGPLVVAGIGAFMIFGSPVSKELFCDKTQNCLATWASALSGWAAAGAAGITIRSLFRQANAQQKQTEFMLGDADPTIDAVQHAENPEQLVVQIRNWNRRSMIIRSIELHNIPEDSLIRTSFNMNVVHAGMLRPWGYTDGSIKTFSPSVLIDGWLSREKSPSLFKITTEVVNAQEERLEDWENVVVEITYELAGIKEIRRQKAGTHIVSSITAGRGELPFYDGSAH